MLPQQLSGTKLGKVTSTNIINKQLPQQLGTDQRMIEMHLKKRNVLAFTNVTELKFSALYILERAT